MGVEEELAVAEGELRGAERQMDRAMRSYLREVSEMREALHQYRVEVEEEREDPRAQAEEKELEREIRAGKHGPGLKALQERIDLDQTTLTDVMSGRDGHWSADALREVFGDRVEAMAAEEGDEPGVTGAPGAATTSAPDAPQPPRTEPAPETPETPGGRVRHRPMHEGGTW
jgi:hypothetical protein